MSGHGTKQGNSLRDDRVIVVTYGNQSVCGGCNGKGSIPWGNTTTIQTTCPTCLGSGVLRPVALS